MFALYFASVSACKCSAAAFFSDLQGNPWRWISCPAGRDGMGYWSWCLPGDSGRWAQTLAAPRRCSRLPKYLRHGNTHRHTHGQSWCKLDFIFHVFIIEHLTFLILWKSWMRKLAPRCPLYMTLPSADTDVTFWQRLAGCCLHCVCSVNLTVHWLQSNI